MATCCSTRFPFSSASGSDPAIQILLDVSTLSSIPLKEDIIDPRLRKKDIEDYIWIEKPWMKLGNALLGRGRKLSP